MILALRAKIAWDQAHSRPFLRRLFTFQAKVVIAEQTEKDIDVTRSQYIPVAVRTQILFFCTYDLVSLFNIVAMLLVAGYRKTTLCEMKLK